MRHVAKLGLFGQTRRYGSWLSQRATRSRCSRSWKSLDPQYPTWPIPRHFVRGAKRKSTVNLDTLPQGVLVKDGVHDTFKEEAGEEVVYPTVIQQVRNNVRKFDNCVILTRVGGFYELYLEQAEKYGPLLNLKIAQKKTSAGPVSMAGFPFYQLDRFLKNLVQDLDQNVAISEEFANNAVGKVRSGDLKFDRRVTRIVTPGTLIDEKFIDPYANNFLLAVMPGIHDERTKGALQAEDGGAAMTTHSTDTPLVGLAWLDLSTGEFNTQSTTMRDLATAIVRIGPTEMILGQQMDDEVRRGIMTAIGDRKQRVTWLDQIPKSPSMAEWFSVLERPVPPEEQATFTDVEMMAGTALIDYVKETLLDSGVKLQPPVKRLGVEAVDIDRQTLRGLEVLSTLRDGAAGGTGSLLHSIRKTVTSSGSRLLRSRLSSPSMSIGEINQRLDLVQHFLQDLPLREGMVAILRSTFDSQRLIQKFSLGRGDADDLVSLLRTILGTKDIASLLSDSLAQTNSADEKAPEASEFLPEFLARFSLEGPMALAARIADAIDEDGLLASHRKDDNESAKSVSMAQDVLQEEGTPNDHAAMSRIVRSKVAKGLIEQSPEEEEIWIMRRSASPALTKLHTILTGQRREKLTLAEELRQKAGAESLTLRWTPGLGHICHIKGPKDVRASLEALPEARSVSSTKSTRSFYMNEWSQLGARIDQLKLRIRAEESRLFQDLRRDVITNLVKLRRNAIVLDELDVACSSATLAHEHGYIRPILNAGVSHKILGGRHPTVKIGLEEQGRAFVSNDCLVGDPHRIWFITGPNMAGKSTFLRQNALITILAQIGSYVPADYAEIGLVDRIFSRIGSADNLFEDQSTFMVEMLETAAILRNATPRSFVIMDEVGRGTTPDDGVAVGYAALWHLHSVNRCRTLFASHFHRLADMTKEWDLTGFYCTDVAETDAGAFSYVHRLRVGVNRRSHALKVAQIAGLPKAAIDVARDVLGKNVDTK